MKLCFHPNWIQVKVQMIPSQIFKKNNNKKNTNTQMCKYSVYPPPQFSSRGRHKPSFEWNKAGAQGKDKKILLVSLDTSFPACDRPPRSASETAATTRFN